MRDNDRKRKEYAFKNLQFSKFNKQAAVEKMIDDLPG